MKLVIVKYNAGNVQSVSFALERLGVNFLISDDADEIRSADKVLFPGVGEASTTMKFLEAKNLHVLLPALKQPFLGICLGMQLMCRHSEENDTPCLGIFDETVKKFSPNPEQKVPHMGWNDLSITDGWLDPELNGRYVYFVHSYFVPVNKNTSAIANYTEPFSAALHKDNFYAVQFHPEKSAESGELVLKSFLKI